jgi:hypothetical protein
MMMAPSAVEVMLSGKRFLLAIVMAGSGGEEHGGGKQVGGGGPFDPRSS